MATPGSFSTPPNRVRRRKQIQSPALSTSVSFLIENDDAEERKQRRKSKLMTNNILSPGGVQASPGRQQPGDKDKRKSVSLSHNGLSNVQLKEHYASCIKLSSENKINAKNAFGLHLIDYMKELLKQSNKEETGGTNFQVASCTLDAGVKIYAYRVDSVHNEAYKVLGTLGRAKDNDQEEADEMETGEDGSQPKQVKKTKKKNTGKTIEMNLKNINCEQLDLDFEVDPFFHKTAAAFDEGGTSGLLSFQIKSKSDKNDLIMDSLADINDIPTATVGESTEDENMVDLTMLRDMYDKLSFDSMEICPQFSGFKFSGWDMDLQDVGGLNLPDDSFDDNVHRFDENAPVTSNAMDSFDTGGGGTDYDGGSDGEPDSIGPITYDGQAANFTDGLASRASLINTTGSTHLALSLQPSEYSYFSQDILSTWAGPLHWKVKPKSKDKSSTTANSSTRTVTKKVPLRINYEDDIDLKKYFSSGKASTHLKETTLEKYAVQMTVLPPDLHYEAENLFKLFIRDFITVKRQADGKELNDEGDQWYDYDNKNDREGFCPVVTDDGDNGYDDDDDNFGDAGDNTFTTQPDILEPSMLSGDNLIAPPNKVRVLDINYAKAAKRIDIKKLKFTMWKMLCENKPEDKENNENENNNLPKPKEIEDEKEDSHVSGVYSFKSMYDALPNKVSTNMAKNLSGPIAFVCLLYLANDKSQAGIELRYNCLRILPEVLCGGIFLVSAKAANL